MNKPYILGLFLVGIILIVIVTFSQREHDSKLESLELSQITQKAKTQAYNHQKNTTEKDPIETNAQSSKSIGAEVNPAGITSIARLAYSCRNIPANDSELEEWVTIANQNNEIPSLIENVISKYERCAGLDRNISYAKLFLEASKRGSDDAIDMLWNLSNKELIEGFGLEQLPRDKLVKQLANFRIEKYGITQRAALLGGEKSMLRLIRGFQHFDPATQGQSFEKSLAYTYLLLETTNDNDKHSKANWYRRSLEKRMTLDEINIASELAEELISKYKKAY